MGCGSSHSSEENQVKSKAEQKPEREQKDVPATNDTATKAAKAGASDAKANESATEAKPARAPREKPVQVQTAKVTASGQTKLVVGPVIGAVSAAAAVVLLEADRDGTLVVVASTGQEAPVRVSIELKAGVAQACCLEGLSEGRRYAVTVEGVSAPQQAAFTTVASKDMRVIAVSCDRYERLLEGETDMWAEIRPAVMAGEVQSILHLGDQVYANHAFTKCYELYTEAEGKVDDVLRAKFFELYADVYRESWSREVVRDIMANCGHVVIWSDNDIYNDFTSAKLDDGTVLPKEILCAGIAAYQRYQRSLRFPATVDEDTLDEFQFHRFGNCGVIVLDMRGNRIAKDGTQEAENPLLNPAQLAFIKQSLSTPGLSQLVVASEIPFVGDSPEACKEKVDKFEFLIDHWPYCDEELIMLLTLVYDWLEENDDRSCAMLGGDIHVGVESVIRDAKTKKEVVHLTTSPITNHVCGFFPDLTGHISDRFSYEHKAVPARNYGDIVCGGGGALTARLVADPAMKKQDSEERGGTYVTRKETQQVVLQDDLSWSFGPGEDGGLVKMLGGVLSGKPSARPPIKNAVKDVVTMVGDAAEVVVEESTAKLVTWPRTASGTKWSEEWKDDDVTISLYDDGEVLFEMKGSKANLATFQLLYSKEPRSNGYKVVKV